MENPPTSNRLVIAWVCSVVSMLLVLVSICIAIVFFANLGHNVVPFELAAATAFAAPAALILSLIGLVTRSCFSYAAAVICTMWLLVMGVLVWIAFGSVMRC